DARIAICMPHRRRMAAVTTHVLDISTARWQRHRLFRWLVRRHLEYVETGSHPHSHQIDRPMPGDRPSHQMRLDELPTFLMQKLRMVPFSVVVRTIGKIQTILVRYAPPG